MAQRSESDTPASKSALRASMRPRTPADVHRASHSVVDHLLGVLEPGEGVLTFAHMADEPDLSELAMHGYELALTRTPQEGWLTVHPWGAPRETHRWGFSQPAADAPTFDLAWISTVLVPGVAFGRDGSRLGHGKGYYDELLSRVPHARCIGVGWECRMVASLPTEPHDRPMHLVVTDIGVHVPKEAT